MTFHGAFNSGALLKAASAKAGLTDFGDDHFRAGLDQFVAACRNDGFVPTAGLESIGESVIKILLNRLRFEATLKRHPEILDEEIVSPLVIIGPGRVGSTKLHRLLANARNIQTTPLWQVMNPIPTIDARALVAYLQTLGAGREVYDPALNGGKGGWRPWLKLQDAVTNQTMSEDTVHRAKVPIIVPGGSTASSSVMYQ